MIHWDRELDASGLLCPLPILKCKKTLNQMQGGQRLRVIATDPGAPADFVDFAEHSGNPLLENRESEGKFYFVLEKAG